MAAWMSAWIAMRDQHLQYKSEAFTDALTGAWNRRYFTRFLASCIDRARERRGDVTLLLFDIDNFKAFNDAFGHREGDEILIQTVRLLNSVIRPTDRVCRLGGDELAVVFDDPAGPRDPRSSHPSSIFEIARRFQRQVLEAGFASLAGNAPGRLTVSGGLATFPWDGPDAQSLLERADERLLESKRFGKNAICFGPRAGDVLHADEPRGGGRS
jgi:diguanylate cyclase (GGDEF)-like protein